MSLGALNFDGNLSDSGVALTPDPHRSTQNAHKISKGPRGHPTDHICLRGRLLTALACNLTLPKLH